MCRKARRAGIQNKVFWLQCKNALYHATSHRGSVWLNDSEEFSLTLLNAPLIFFLILSPHLPPWSLTLEPAFGCTQCKSCSSSKCQSLNLTTHHTSQTLIYHPRSPSSKLFAILRETNVWVGFFVGGGAEGFFKNYCAQTSS